MFVIRDTLTAYSAGLSFIIIVKYINGVTLNNKIKIILLIFISQKLLNYKKIQTYLQNILQQYMKL